MKEPLLIPSNDQNLLSVSLTDSGLMIHKDIYAFCKNRNLVSGRALVSALIAFPSSFLTILSENERDSFKDKVFDLMKKFLPEDYFTRVPKKFAYGALKPLKKPDGSNS